MLVCTRVCAFLYVNMGVCIPYSALEGHRETLGVLVFDLVWVRASLFCCSHVFAMALELPGVLLSPSLIPAQEHDTAVMHHCVRLYKGSRGLT